MLHTKIEAAAPLDPTIAGYQKTLTLLAAGMDARFVRAGTTLATAVDTIDRVIAGLDGVTAALDESVAGVAVASLKSVAAQIEALPSVQRERDGDMGRVGGEARVLQDHVMDMRQALRVLHIYGLNIKIAASGETAFVDFVDNMAMRLASGQEQLEGILTKLKELARSVRSVQQAGRLLGEEARKVVPAVPERLARDASALHEHLGSVAGMARRVAAIARTVQGRVATMLGALQVGDSTRQRLEHVVSALQFLEAGRQGTAPAVHRDVVGVVYRLLAAQLDASAADFDRDAGLLVESLRALKPDAADLLSLIEDEAGRNGRPFLLQIEEAVGEAAAITAQLSEADRRSSEMLGLIAGTVDELTCRLARLQRVQFDVQDIATNTRLLCRRHGELGKAVSVVAKEVDVHAGLLGKAMTGIRRPIDELADVNAALTRKRSSADEPDIGARISGALLVVREGCRRTDLAVREGGDDARQLIDLLGLVGDGIAAELALGETMRRTAAAMREPACPDAPSPAASAVLAALLPSIFALYTMAQEREVHAANVPDGFALPAAPAPAPADDDDDDGLF